MKIMLSEDAIPCGYFNERWILFLWKDAVRDQLQSMENKGAIEKVPIGEPYEWCHPLVIVSKKESNESRITVDLTVLNKFVKRPAYPTRVPREVVPGFPPGMTFLPTLDSRHGYWQIPLDEASSKLSTFMSPWGAFRFKRRVVGLVSVGDDTQSSHR